MATKKVKIIHHINGETMVTRKFAELALDRNHVKNGGAYCKPDEVNLYFDEKPGKSKTAEVEPAEEQQKTAAVEPAETTTRKPSRPRKIRSSKK